MYDDEGVWHYGPTADSPTSLGRALDEIDRENSGSKPIDSETSPAAQPTIRTQIQEKCADLAEFLIRKNEAYGDSLSNSVSVFSSLDADAAHLVRMDDKLTRIKNRGQYKGDDDFADLLGYLMMWAVKHNIEFK